MFAIGKNVGARKIAWDNVKCNFNRISNVKFSHRLNPSWKNKDTKSTAYNVIPQPRKTVSKEERQSYEGLFPIIVNDLTQPYEDIPDVTQRYRKVLEYNMPNHKQASGLAVVGAYKAFAPPEDITPLNIFRASILGWCTDLILTCYKISDDFIDGSETRRGLPCWHRQPGVGRQAINDAVLIEQGPYILLKKYLSDHRCYVPCVEWLHEAHVKTTLGQTLDAMNRINGKPNFDVFTASRCKALAKHKGAYPEYILPMKLVLYLAGWYEESSHKEFEEVLCMLGDYLTTQNDILDCYGDPSITGKVGSDIREGKCTWLVVNALEHGTHSQREILKEHYGKPGNENELIIRTLYEELGILDLFLKYEKDTYNAIRERIKQTNLPKEFLFKFVDTTYGRYED